MTAHKAQGLTLPRVVIDFVSCKGTESPYVMASRCTSLDGLLIMRPFPISKISCHRSQEARDEFNRLQVMRLQTTATYGTPEQQTSTREHLSDEETNRSTQIEDFFADGSSANPAMVARLVQQIQDDGNQTGKGTVRQFGLENTR